MSSFFPEHNKSLGAHKAAGEAALGERRPAGGSAAAGSPLRLAAALLLALCADGLDFVLPGMRIVSDIIAWWGIGALYKQHALASVALIPEAVPMVSGLPVWTAMVVYLEAKLHETKE